jgi:DNA-binding transcriptional regulator PaaX
MKESRRNKKSEIIGIVLKILGGGVLLPAIFLFPGSAILINKFLKDKGINKDYLAFRRILNRLKNKRLLKIIDKNGDAFLQITEDGKKELLRYDIDNLAVKIPKNWDDIWRIVIFDIPEKQRLARSALSRKLKELNFYPLQKSVFVFPYKCGNEIDFIKEYFDVGKFIIQLETSTLGEYQDLILKRYFNLL